MKGNLTREQGLRWTAYGLLVLLVLVGAYAGMLFLKVDEAETAIAVAHKSAEESSAAAARAQAQIKTSAARIAETEQSLQPLLAAKAQLEKLEAEVSPVLEAASKGGKPATRAASLATMGVIAQVVHGLKSEVALNAFDRALVADKDNCAAQVGLTLSGEKTIELSPDCQSMMPVAKTADSKPAAPAAAAAAPAPAPAAPAAPAAAAPAAVAPAAPVPAAKADEKK